MIALFLYLFPFKIRCWTFDVRCSSFSVNLPQFSQRKTKLVLTGSYTGVLSQLYSARVGLDHRIMCMWPWSDRKQYGDFSSALRVIGSGYFPFKPINDPFHNGQTQTGTSFFSGEER